MHEEGGVCDVCVLEGAVGPDPRDPREGWTNPTDVRFCRAAPGPPIATDSPAPRVPQSPPGAANPGAGEGHCVAHATPSRPTPPANRALPRPREGARAEGLPGVGGFDGSLVGPCTSTSPGSLRSQCARNRPRAARTPSPRPPCARRVAPRVAAGVRAGDPLGGVGAQGSLVGRRFIPSPGSGAQQARAPGSPESAVSLEGCATPPRAEPSAHSGVGSQMLEPTAPQVLWDECAEAPSPTLTHLSTPPSQPRSRSPAVARSRDAPAASPRPRSLSPRGVPWGGGATDLPWGCRLHGPLGGSSSSSASATPGTAPVPLHGPLGAGRATCAARTAPPCPHPPLGSSPGYRRGSRGGDFSAACAAPRPGPGLTQGDGARRPLPPPSSGCGQGGAD